MGYEPLYHAAEIWKANAWFFGRFYFYLSLGGGGGGTFLIKQLFHSRLFLT